MTIRYRSGRTIEAILLTRTDTTIRAVAKGSDDVVELTHLSGVWVTEDCEPVQVIFEWQKIGRPEMAREEDCICSHDLAAHLIHMLYTPADDQPETAAPLSDFAGPALAGHLV